MRACWEMFDMSAIFLKCAGSVYSTWAYKTFISTAGFAEINQEKYFSGNQRDYKHIIY